MGFWSRKKKPEKSADDDGKAPEKDEAEKPSPTVKPAKRRSSRRKNVVALEVKLVALKGVAAGLKKCDVAELAGVSVTTVTAWLKAHAESGVDGLVAKASSVKTRRLRSHQRDTKVFPAQWLSKWLSNRAAKRLLEQQSPENANVLGALASPAGRNLKGRTSCR